MRNVALLLLALAFPGLALRLPAQADGIWPKFGGPPPGAGFSAGLEYRKSGLARGLLDFRAEAVVSTKVYTHGELHFILPHLWRDRLTAEFTTTFRRYPQEDFWGFGMDTLQDHRSDFLVEDIDQSASLAFAPRRWLRIGAEGGVMRLNAGPGKDPKFPPVEQVFAGSQLPALLDQPDYFHFGSFVEVDRRDRPSYPRAGGRYALRWTRYSDRQHGRFDFDRLELDLRQFVRVAQTRGTVAMRLNTVITAAGAGRQVPFFLQPTAGGANDVRGFHQYRFRDRNAMVLNLEYRRPALSFLDVVFFGDAGQVFRRASDLAVGRFRGSAGVGGRLVIRERVLVGLDAAWSPEGTRVWMRAAHTF